MPDRAAAPASPDLTILFSSAVLLAALLIAYGGALRGSFQFDDFNVIVDNRAVHSLSAWWQTMPGIRPLLKLSYAINWVIAPNAAAFISFNLCCHCLSSLLVLALCRRCLGAENVFAALLSALIFALHPAQTEAVTYICGRSVALMSLFYLAAVATACSERKVLRRVCSPALFALALSTKETAWTLPLALMLIDCRRGLSARAALRRLWPHIAVLLGFGGALLSVGAYRRMLEHMWSLRSPLANLGWQVDGVFYLLTRPLLSLQTNIDPDLAAPRFDALWWSKLLLLSALLAWGIKQRRAAGGFALLWFALHLLPTNSLWPRNDIANDRQLYLALIGPALWLGQFLTRLARAPADLPRRVALSGSALLTLVLAAATLARNTDYRDEISLWQATARSSPHKARVWNNLGYAYQQAGRIEEARSAYLYAQVLDPNDFRARVNHLLLPAVVPSSGAEVSAGAADSGSGGRAK